MQLKIEIPNLCCESFLWQKPRRQVQKRRTLLVPRSYYMLDAMTLIPTSTICLSKNSHTMEQINKRLIRLLRAFQAPVSKVCDLRWSSDRKPPAGVYSISRRRERVPHALISDHILPKDPTPQMPARKTHPPAHAAPHTHAV